MNGVTVVPLAREVHNRDAYLAADSATVAAGGGDLPPVTRSGSTSTGITKSKNAKSISSQD